jgi:hypothetical protein
LASRARLGPDLSNQHAGADAMGLRFASRLVRLSPGGVAAPQSPMEFGTRKTQPRFDASSLDVFERREIASATRDCDGGGLRRARLFGIEEVIDTAGLRVEGRL